MFEKNSKTLYLTSQKSKISHQRRWWFYLHNKIKDPDQRATVLSYKGLVFNAAYGVIGILFAGLIAKLRLNVSETSPSLSTALVETESFRQSITYCPWYLGFMLLVVAIICATHFRQQSPDK